MSVLSQLEMYENHPLYRDMLKTILMSQIQGLLDQLSTYIGEETVILAASLEDGKITDIGTECGRAFLKDNDIKTNFLGFCLKRHYERQSEKTNKVLSHSNSSQQNSQSSKEHKNQSPTTKKSFKKPPQTSLNDPSTQGLDETATNEGDSTDLTCNEEEIGISIVKAEPVEEDEEFPNMTEMFDVCGPDDDDQSGVEEQDASDGILKSRDENSLDPWTEGSSSSLSLQDQISSKRKQKAPKRKKTDDPESTDDVADKKADSDPEIDHDRSTKKPKKPGYKWVVDKPTGINMSPNRIHGADGVEGGFGAENYGLGSSLGPPFNAPIRFDTECGIPMNSDDGQHSTHGGDMSGINVGMSHSFHGDEMNRSFGTPQQHVSGALMVTRGNGRYEKLLKCEQCGKVCRTSNMARHKKRYCLGIPYQGRPDQLQYLPMGS